MAKQNQKSKKQRGGDWTSWLGSLVGKKPEDTATVAAANVASANVASANVASANVASDTVKPVDENKVQADDVKEPEPVVGGKKHKKSSKKSKSKKSRAKKHKKSVKR